MQEFNWSVRDHSKQRESPFACWQIGYISVLIAMAGYHPNSSGNASDTVVSKPGARAAGSKTKTTSSVTDPDNVGADAQLGQPQPDNSQASAARVPLASAVIDWSSTFGPRRPVTPARVSAQLGNIFGAKLSDLKPGVLVFPITDGSGAVRYDGLGLSYQALIAISRASAKSPLALYPDVALDMLQDAGCDRRGHVLTQELRLACTKSLDAQMSVSAAILPQGTAWELEIVFYDSSGAKIGTPHKHAVPRGQINLVPGIIAGDVCDQLPLSLTTAERSQLLQPQVSTDEDSAYLTRLLTEPLKTYHSHIKAQRFLKANPRCLGAWRRVVSTAWDPSAVFRWHRNAESLPAEARLDVHVANRLLQFGFGEYSFDELRRASTELPGDRAIGLLLLRQILQAGDRQLADRALEAWRAQDQSYMARFARGRFLLEWADSVSALADFKLEDSTAASVWREQHLDAARTELEAAAEKHPQGWQVHNLLISLANAQSRPRDEMERHFAASTLAAPGNVSAYRRKLQYLSPFSRGTIEDLATFAEECVKTGRWDEGIPQLMLEAVDLATCNPQTAATSFAALRNARLWQAMQAYYAAAEQQRWAADYGQAINCFTLWGASSGHAKDVAGHFQTLKEDYATKIFQREVFESPVTYQYLKDLSVGEGDSPIDPDASVRLALHRGDLDRAEKLLEKLQTSLKSETVQSARSAVTMGRRLLADRRLQPSANELLDMLVDMGGRHSPPTPPRAAQRRSVRADEQGIKWDAAGTFNFAFPIGFRHGVLSGEIKLSGLIERFGVVLHTSAPRDTVTVMYLPDEHLVRIVRSRRLLAEYPLAQDVIPFRFEFGAQEDTLQPAPGIQINTPVVDDVPSGFTFEGSTIPGPESGTIQIRNVKVELLD